MVFNTMTDLNYQRNISAEHNLNVFHMQPKGILSYFPGFFPLFVFPPQELQNKSLCKTSTKRHQATKPVSSLNMF